MIRRREFITSLGGAAACPLAAGAQRTAMPVVALVFDSTADKPLAAFHKGMSETGYVEGQNVSIEYHLLAGRYERLPALMSDLVRRRVTLIATPGFTNAAIAAKAATATIPIVFGARRRPGQARLGREPPPAGWQCDRLQFVDPRGDDKAAGAPSRIGAQGSSGRRNGQSR
jgi:ABC-type uncharacterized transport system substrate-binding protein